MSPVILTDEARDLVRARIAASRCARPVARIVMQDMATPTAADADRTDWTIKRKDLWAVTIGEDDGIAEGDPRRATVDGIVFVCDYFPIRFQLSVRDGHLRVGAGA